MDRPVVPPSGAADHPLQAENEALRGRLRELEDTLAAIHSGDVDALVINNTLYTLESVHDATDRLRQDVLGQMEDAVFAFDVQGCVMFVNRAAERRYKVLASDILGKPAHAVYREQLAAEDVSPSSALLPSSLLATHWLPDGTWMEVELVSSPLLGQLGQRFGSLAVIRDVTQRRRAASRRAVLTHLTETLRDADDPEAIAFEAARILGQALAVRQVGYGAMDPAGEQLTVQRAWTGPGSASRAGSWKLQRAAPPAHALLAGATVAVADTRSRPDASAFSDLVGDRTLAFVHVPLIEQGRLAALLFVHDDTARAWTDDELEFIREFADRTRSSAERARSARALAHSEARLRETNEGLEAAIAARTRELTAAEEALRQSQKMEAIGQLTGGLAHDFNNLLGGVSASLQILQTRLKQRQLDGIERYVDLGQSSVKRAAALTQRLLAFARRQTLDPKPIDLNRLVQGLEDLIRRTVGPDVQVEVAGTVGLWVTKVDPSQLENALLNLCINARDAMLPDGGQLRVETSNRTLDAHGAQQHGLPPGEYVAMCVTDTGSGMPPEVMEHIFDPFFTTKPTGQGTGLGLSMVYGFARQSGGSVRVASTPGQGTTMCMFLPRFAGAALHDPRPIDSAALSQGDGGTVLLIEDEATIRELTEEVLVEAGYSVLTAADGPSGLRLFHATPQVDLLVTDVGLPGGLNGRQVADAARQVRPDLKVLFITGYAQNAAVGNGLLAPGMEVLTKPFDISILTDRVREMIGRS